MKIMMLGSPGVGKGTQSQFIADKFSIPQISTGDMLREVMASGSGLGNKIKSYLDSGQLVPDELIITMVKDRIEQPDCAKGFLLDGFPRTIAQAQALVDLNIVFDHVIVIEVSEEIITQRLSGRRVHKPSGRTYHVDFQPPKTSGLDDITGEPLTQRDDDKPEVIQQRFAVYQAETKPLVDFYTELSTHSTTQLHHINGEQSVAEVKTTIERVLSLA